MWVRSKIHQELRKSISLLGHWVDILVCWTKRKLLLVHQREHQQAEEVFDEVWLLNHCCTGQADETEPWAWGETNYKQVKSSKGSTSLILREPNGISSSHRDVVVKETQPGQKEINCFFFYVIHKKICNTVGLSDTEMSGSKVVALLKELCCNGCSNFLMPCCVGWSADVDYDYLWAQLASQTDNDVSVDIINLWTYHTTGY